MTGEKEVSTPPMSTSVDLCAATSPAFDATVYRQALGRIINPMYKCDFKRCGIRQEKGPACVADHYDDRQRPSWSSHPFSLSFSTGIESGQKKTKSLTQILTQHDKISK
nr:uncharacterized protein LOC109157439 [Ipomoea batatas]